MAEFIMTVGVKYGRRPDADQHPLGLHADSYTVIEAPTEELARAIAVAITGREFAFLYDRDDYPDEKLERYHPRGEELHIGWTQYAPLEVAGVVVAESRRVEI